MVSSVTASLALKPAPSVCVIGVATPGGVLPEDLRRGLLEAADAGLTLVNGLHHFLADDRGDRRPGRRRWRQDPGYPQASPRWTGLSFWSGKVYGIRGRRLAILGTDCAVGKRTTTALLLKLPAAGAA